MSNTKFKQQDRPKIGELFPTFEMVDQDENTVKLEDFKGQPVVLFFYPRDFSGGCVIEACSFRDKHEIFQEAGAVVLGISPDSPAMHRQFRKAFGLPYSLLSDKKNAFKKAIGFSSGALLGLDADRMTFIIDREGKLRHQYSSIFNMTKHVKEAINIVEAL